MKRRSAFLDSQRVIGGGFTAHERQLRKALKRLIAAADEVISENDFPGCHCEQAIDALVAATSEAERILEPKRK